MDEEQYLGCLTALLRQEKDAKLALATSRPKLQRLEQELQQAATELDEQKEQTRHELDRIAQEREVSDIGYFA